RVGQNIGDLNGLSLKQDSPGKTCSPGRSYERLVIFNVFRREATTRSDVVACLCRAHDLSHIRLAQSCGRLDYRIEHGLQVEGGTADDLEHIGSGGLLLE